MSVFLCFSDALEANASEFLSLHRKFQIFHPLPFCCDSFFTCIFLRSFQHHFKTIVETEMANVAQKMIPFITFEIFLGQYVCELFFGVTVLDLDLGLQIDSIKQPIKRNSVSPGNMSHCGTPSLLQTDTTKLLAFFFEKCEVLNELDVDSYTGFPELDCSDSCSKNCNDHVS